MTLKIETFLGPKIATSETHVNKITNVTVFYMALGLMLIMLNVFKFLN